MTFASGSVCVCVSFRFHTNEWNIHTYVCMCAIITTAFCWCCCCFCSSDRTFRFEVCLFFLVAERTSAQWFPFCLQILAYLCDCVCACVCMFTWIWELFCVNVIFVMSIPLSFSHCYTKRVYLLFVISVVFGVVGVVAVFVFVVYETMCIIYAFSLVSFIFMCFKRISQQQYAI